MTLQQAYLVSGVIGGIGVIATLLYLAAQVRQNTVSLRMGTGQRVTEDLRTLYRYSAEKDSADVMYRGFQDFEKLEGSDRMRFYAMMHDYFFAFQNAYYQMESGALDKRYWSAAVSSLTHLATFPGVRRYWADRKFYYADEFRDFLDRNVFVPKGEAQYHLAGSSFAHESPGISDR